MAPEPDVLDSDTPPSRAGRFLLALVALALLTGALFWAEGLRRADAERDAVRRCGDGAAEAVGDAERRLALMAAYVSPVIGSTTTDVDTDLRQMIGDQAPLALPPVEAALETCQDLTIWPLHDETREARDGWVALLEAERARLQQLAEDGSGFASGFDEIKDLQEQAEAAQP